MGSRQKSGKSGEKSSRVGLEVSGYRVERKVRVEKRSVSKDRNWEKRWLRGFGKRVSVSRVGFLRVFVGKNN